MTKLIYIDNNRLNVYFTLVFATPGEGPARTYDLVFHPCPVWMRGDKEINIPNSDNPRYELGSLDKLVKRENIEDSKSLSPNVFVFVHWAGHGHDGDLGKLLQDLENEGWNPIVLNAETGNVFFYDGRYGLSE